MLCYAKHPLQERIRVSKYFSADVRLPNKLVAELHHSDRYYFVSSLSCLSQGHTWRMHGIVIAPLPGTAKSCQEPQGVAHAAAKKY